MNQMWAFIYGFIQGVTEFLPVSSSGHLALLPYFFELKDPGVMFDLLMHLGTAIAVIAYFHKDILTLIKEGLDLLLKRDLKNTGFFQNFVISTFFSFLLILIVKKLALTYGRNSLFIGINFIIFGFLMLLSDRVASKGVDLTKKTDLKKSILIGLSQSLAIFPGVSRSGITLTSSRYLGLSRVDAGRYSFLLSLPVILGSIIFKLPEILSGQATYVPFDIIVIGVTSSLFFGLLTIHFFLKLIGKIGLMYFSFYRFLLGGALIILYLIN